MAIKVGTLTVEIAGNVARLQRDMGKAAHVMKKAHRQIRRVAMGIGAAIGVAFSARAIKDFVGGAIGAMENLDKLSQKVAVSSADLSTMGYAATRAGSSLEGLKTGVRMLAKNLADADGPSAEVQAALDKLGLSAYESSGRLKPMVRIIREVADGLKGMSDGAEKTAIAQQLLGRAGADLIPFFNLGAAGIKKLQDRAASFGLQVSTQTAKEAAAFEDALTDLKAQAQGVANAIARHLLPGLTTVTTAFTEAALKGSLWQGIAESIGALFSERMAMESENTLVGRIRLASDAAEELAAQIAALEKLKMGRGGFFGAGGITGEGEAELKALYQQYGGMISLVGQLEEIQRKGKADAAAEARKSREKLLADAAKREAADLAKRAKEELALSERTTTLLYASARKRFQARAKLRENAAKREADIALKHQQRLAEIQQQEEQARERSWSRQEAMVQQWAASSADAFVSAAERGKWAWGEMARSIIRDMARMAAMRQIFGPLLGGLFPSGRSRGSGQTSTSEIPDLSATGSAAMTQARAGVTVQIIDQRSGGARIAPTSSRGADGGEIIQFVIRDEVRAGISDGSYDAQMASSYGVARQGVQ